MNTTSVWRRFFIGIVMLLVLASASSAHAAPPVKQTEVVLVPPSSTEPPTYCGSVEILADNRFEVTTFIFFDNQSHPVLAQQHYDITGRMINSVTGKSVPFTERMNLKIDLQTGTQTLTLMFRIIVPGTGAVLIDAGRVIQDQNNNFVFQAGHHPVLSGNVQSLCTLLS